ncbi:MAG: PDZ domain-containing protein [Deltaproteobacteria bacterium]|nr:PDZ domain-containing protein [Deltaproteobacteria bacterium]
MKRPWITATNVLLAIAAVVCLGWAVSQVVAAIVAPPIDTAGAKAPAPPPQARPWSEIAQIIDRNLFNASTLAPAEVTASEQYEQTRLPLELRATLAAGDQSWAVFEDQASRKHLVARVNQELCRDCQFSSVTLQRVERCRVVVLNQGRREELRLDTLAACAAGGVARAARSSAPPVQARGRAVNSAVQRLAENRFAVERGQMEAAAANPAALFSQARILPRYDQGKMVGVQLNAIRPGSIFAQAGIQDGDTVTEVNRVTVATPEDSQRLLQEFAQGGQLNVTVTGRDGAVRQLEYVAQ